MKLTPSQSEIMQCGLLETGFNCILQMPTGSGKTWLAKHAIRNVLANGKRAVYVAPTRALAQELYEEWQESFEEIVGIYTGDYGTVKNKYPTPFTSAQILILTPERLDACTRHWRSHWEWIPEIDLIIVDELHLLGDGHRGARLEGTLNRFLRLNPFTRVLGLSATLGNIDELSEWLDGVHYQSYWRPIPLSWRTAKFKSPQDKPNLLLREIQDTSSSGGQTLAFVQSRRRAEELDKYLKENGIRCYHHHGGLDSSDRNDVETTYRSGEIEALVATPTLEVGVNLPTRKVVLYDLQYFNGQEFVRLSVNQVWQRAGRAGRPGYDQQGEVVLFAPTWDKFANHYDKGKFEPIRSRLNSSKSLSEQVIAEVASGLCRHKEQLYRTFHTTLAAKQDRLPALEACISTMIASEMLQEAQDDSTRPPRLKATRLGRIAVRQMLLPDAVLHLNSHLKHIDSHKLSFLDLIMIAASSPGFEPLLPCDFEDLEELHNKLVSNQTILLQGHNDEITSRFNIGGRRIISIIKTSLVARAWTRHGEIDHVAQKHGCYPYEIRRVNENLIRFISAMIAITTPPKNILEEMETVITPTMDEAVSLKERLHILLNMIQHGLTEENATLTYIPGLGGTLARRLASTGITDIEDLAQADPEELASIRGISTTRANKWIELATDLLSTHSPVRVKEIGTSIQHQIGSWPKGIDPYRLGRAKELHVENRSNNQYIVTGGLDPHLVQNHSTTNKFTCDCPDFNAGHTCKHILAVRISHGESSLTNLVNRLNSDNTENKIDLHSMWLESRR